MNKLFIITAVFFSLTFAACGDKAITTSSNDHADTESATKKTVDHLKIDAFKKLVDAQSGVLIDVRTPREHEAGSIAGTTHNINVSSSDFKEKLGKLDKKATYLVYCRSGGRSRRALGIMESMGFTNIYDLTGGYLGWSKAGYK